jgi:CRISPR-associated endonuclease Csn1
MSKIKQPNIHQNIVYSLDIGTNSIGWALLNYNFNSKTGKILGSGSRIIPMSNAVLIDFEKGNTKSQTAERTEDRGIRRLYARGKLRRERLHRVLNILNFLPEHYAKKIDFVNKKGQFKSKVIPLIAYLNTKNEDDKYKFFFQKAYNEMKREFENNGFDFSKPNQKRKERQLPYDWTLYYLRKKALTEKIEKEELAWILLNFNQKRGYYHARAENEIKDDNKKVSFESLKVDKLVETEKKFDSKILYNIYFENGWLYENKQTTKPENWLEKTRDFIVTESILKDGTVKRNFKEVNAEEDWEAIKKSTEQKIDKQFVGKFIYETLLNDPKKKINGNLIQTIDRSFYKKELKQILQTQKQFHEELLNKKLFEACLDELYQYNIVHKNNALKQDKFFEYLFLDDILYYHRPLKSQKRNISRCKYEKRVYKVNQETKEKYVQGIPKSHPLYQEFRIWQLLDNLAIWKRQVNQDGKLKTNVDVTDEFLVTEEDYNQFFKFLNTRKELSQKQFLAYFIKNKKEQENYRWNYTDDDSVKLDCNQTIPSLQSRLSKEDINKLDTNKLIHLWHILYSVTDKEAYNTAISKFCSQHNLNKESKKKLQKAPLLKSDYANYSEKSVKKILALLRYGKYWDYEKIDENTNKRIQRIIDGEIDENLDDDIREKLKDFENIEDFQGLPLWLAEYIIYNVKPSEVKAEQWKTSKDLEDYLKGFSQHSMRNPIVEQVLLESLRLTLDVWVRYADNMNIPFTTYTEEKTNIEKKSYKRLFNQINIEIGRDLKKPKKVRERIFQNNNKRKKINDRLKKLLYEIKNQGNKEVIPSSRTHFEKLKIFEEGVLEKYDEKDLKKITIDEKLPLQEFLKKESPTSKEMLKYVLWLEQKYQSPYTGKIIPMSSLFSDKFEVEHIIPQSKFLDNSYNNKIICETSANRFKDNRLAYNFIISEDGGFIPKSNPSLQLLTKKEYEEFVEKNYEGTKKANLLATEVETKMNSRQKTDMQYVSKTALKTFSNIVREKDEKEATVKKLLPVSGGVTSILKREWGLTKVWSKLLEDRFKRLNQLVHQSDEGLFGNYRTDKNTNTNFFRPTVPIEFQANFDIKRIDHRHHTLDALIIGVTTRSHINYINNHHAKENIKRFDLGKKLRDTEIKEIENVRTGIKEKREVLSNYKKPWETFTQEVKENLKTVIPSFKQNLRVINKATNKYFSYKDKEGILRLDRNGQPKKDLTAQTTQNWAIRKPLHEETYYGILRKGINKGKLVRRVKLDQTFDEKKIETVSSSSVKKILSNHLKQDKWKNHVDDKGKKLKPQEVAFSQVGIEDMNNNILKLNNGRKHQPIYRARLIFNKGKAFPVGKIPSLNSKDYKSTKFVKTASGTNLYFCIYKNEEGNTKYYVPSFEEILETQKLEKDLPLREKNNVPNIHPDDINYTLKFYLQPHDLVFVPNDEYQFLIIDNVSIHQIKQIYKFVDGSGTTANFVPAHSANVIFNLSKKMREEFIKNYDLDDKLIKNEYGLGSPQLKNQNTIDGTQIKAICHKLIVDRLGNITKVIK